MYFRPPSSTDRARFGGIAAEFWGKATPAQRRHLLGFSEGFLRVTVYAGKRLVELVEQRGVTAGDREANRAAARATRRRGDEATRRRDGQGGVTSRVSV